VGGTPIEALSIAAAQDRSLATFAHGQVDRARRTGDQRDRGRLVALAENAKRPVAPFEAEVLDVGGAGLAHPQPVQPEQHRERRVLAVVLLGGEQEHAELGAVQPARIGRMDLRAAHVLRRVRGDTSVDVGEAVEAAHRRQASVDRRRRQAPLFHPAAVQLDVRTGRRQNNELAVGRPLEEAA
jgi:hypothetical protein